jgi:hypothetical protein
LCTYSSVLFLQCDERFFSPESDLLWHLVACVEDEVLDAIVELVAHRRLREQALITQNCDERNHKILQKDTHMARN